MLGQPISMVVPEVIGFEIKGKIKEGITATDLVLTITEQLRKKGVVGKFVEFYGKGLRRCLFLIAYNIKYGYQNMVQHAVSFN